MLRVKPIGASRVFSVPLRLGASQRAISSSVVARAAFHDESTNKVHFTGGRIQDTYPVDVKGLSVPEWQQGMVLPGRFRGGYSPANGNPGPSARYGGGSPAAQQPASAAPKYGPRGGRGGQFPGQQAPQQPPQYQQQQYQPQQYQPQYQQQQQQYQPYGAPGGQQMGASQGFQTSAAPRDQANYGSSDLSYLANASVEEKWAALRDNPDAFWDNRETKRNPRGPDFKLKERDADVALWVVSNDTPEWARQQYGQGMDFSRLGAPGQGSAGPAVSFEEVQHLAAASPAEKWEHWRANPDMWWDNRETKRNPRAPDFKIKNRDVDAALWIDSKDTPPDIRQHYGLPAVASGPAAAADIEWLASASLEEKWAHLQANPGAWWDNRESKKNPRAPDFKLKSLNGAVDAVLWLSSAGTPDWAIQQYGPGTSSRGSLPPVPTQEYAALATASTEEKWAYLKKNPQAFWDNRTTKTNPRAPDYKLKSREVDVALWVDSQDTPAWARQEFAPPAN